MRLFIAFDVPEDVSSSLSEVQTRIVFGGKCTKPKEFHLTLKFLGEVEKERLSILIDELSKIIFTPFEVSLSEIGVFPNVSDPRVLWAGLEPQDTICALQQQVDSATQKLGFAHDKRFHPHLTLARIKSVNDKGSFAQMIDTLKIEPLKFQVSSFKLIRSTLTPEGPKYGVLDKFNAQQ